MKRGRTEESKKSSKRTGLKVAGTMLKIVGIGLAAGVALLAATEKTMSKAFPEQKEELPEDELVDEGEE